MYNHTVRDDQGNFLRMLGRVTGLTVPRRNSPPRSRQRSPARSPSRSPRRRGSVGCRCSAGMRDLRTFLESAITKSTWEHESSVTYLQKRFGAVAERSVRDVAEGDLKVIWDLVMEVTRERRDVMKGKVEELLDGDDRRCE